MYLSQTPLKQEENRAVGRFVDRYGNRFLRIEHADQMPPFFMTLVSHSDHWMFISSSGGLSAGRGNEDNALFPYYTDDKITRIVPWTGPITALRVTKGGTTYLWHPFSSKYEGIYPIDRHLSKSVWGNELLFEEVNKELQIRFAYRWRFSERFGFVRSCALINEGAEDVQIDLLDGVQNILPYGVDSGLQNERSNLANAYKRSELHPESKLGIYALSAIIVDRAEPAEALKASVCWSMGLPDAQVLVSSEQIPAFLRGEDIAQETDKKGVAGAYLLSDRFELPSKECKEWHLCLDGQKTQPQIMDLVRRIGSDVQGLKKDVEEDLLNDGIELKKIVAKADGLQQTADELCVARHYANVLFNVMRGGIFEEDYRIETKDWAEYIHSMNNLLFETNKKHFEALPAEMEYSQLQKADWISANPDLTRLLYEYLPLTFSRRHGDPSRPWNRFDIELKNEDGSRYRAYAGNWRDIFQNWEALALSFPTFMTGMIIKFLNASTVDGYNPYRISREGVDWEVIEPDDSWSYIGYWGDHQIIYLLKLLEIAKAHGQLDLVKWANDESLVFANVPYRIRSFDDIVADPQDTIWFDDQLHEDIENRVAQLGNDQRLMNAPNGQMLKSSLMEKLLISWLTKLYNFIPEAGIWMNTQRPEWNDANNALVGNGVSMVTLNYMRRFTQFLMDWVREEAPESFRLHEEVRDLLRSCRNELEAHKGQLDNGWDDKTRYKLSVALGRHGESYRERAYKGFGMRHVAYAKEELLAALELSIRYMDQTIQCNRKDNGLYHAYNLIHLGRGEWKVTELYDMLEGQVAVLSSKLLDDEQSLEVLDSLKRSALFRPDQFSYLLYPNRDIPGFFDRNHIPEDRLEKNRLLRQMRERGDKRLLETDARGQGYFNGSITNAQDVQAIMEQVIYEYPECGDRHQRDVLGIFEDMFNHKAFTGRSGTFFAYEGLGSIYWHMVSKLLVAVQETLLRYPDSPHKGRLVDHYYEIRAGIGVNKSPELYGAFPTDPYSHTPFNRGAQQPGMTGQVKEDILNRWSELGVAVENGQISFSPAFLSKEEWLTEESVFEYLSLQGKFEQLKLYAGELAFTYCQVPIVYKKGRGNGIRIGLKGGEEVSLSGTHRLGEDYSAALFERNGQVEWIRVDIV